MQSNTNTNTITDANYKESTIKHGSILQLQLILNSKGRTDPGGNRRQF